MFGVLKQLDELNGDPWERADPMEFLTKSEMHVVLRNRLQESRTALPLCQLAAIGIPYYEFGKDQTLALEPLVTEHTTDGVCGLLMSRVVEPSLALLAPSDIRRRTTYMLLLDKIVRVTLLRQHATTKPATMDVDVHPNPVGDEDLVMEEEGTGGETPKPKSVTKKAKGTKLKPKLKAAADLTVETTVNIVKGVTTTARTTQARPSPRQR